MAMQLLLMENQRALRRERLFRDRTNPFEVFDDVEMYVKYRFTRFGCMHIIDLLEARLTHPTRRNHALPASLQVFVALEFYGKGSVLDSTGTIHGISQATASRAIRRVSKELVRLRHRVIKFPTTPSQVRTAQREFFEVAGFPQVVGAVDGTHVEIHGCDYGPDEYIYVNRKNKHSINVQLICDANYKIINVVSRWPGSTHDSRILQSSRIGQLFESGQLQGILLGDSGYALRPWLMTPFLHPSTPAERAYNR